jgi:hypothetical protein
VVGVQVETADCDVIIPLLRIEEDDVRVDV